ncbi:MAG: aminotransferase class I/II-fold pyridoxal phosphate-dependent enzyme [Lachnospiraceae bacterium]|nr:aminotransferase class I/II-fold pyridoxal phosphate-dependent enzyme [Lachnospiraceae bacterium]
MNYIYDKLVNYSQENIYPFHMPGHKRNEDRMSMVSPYAIDITEIDGFDNLHEPREIIRQGMERASRIYKSTKAYYLVNGTSCGLLAGIAAATKHGGEILVARNCHKSVYNAIYINELKPYYVYPRDVNFGGVRGVNGEICKEDVEEMLKEHPGISLVVITSPTYEGVVSDIEGIAEIVHRYGKRLLVDEAHGAHLGFHPYFPESAVRKSADMVVQSIHKTLPAFTQTALFHWIKQKGTKPEISDEKLVAELERYLAIYQTSSPSYVLMSGIDKAMEFVEEQGDEAFAEYAKRLQRFYEETKALKEVQVLSTKGRDPSKIVIFSRDASRNGTSLYDILLHEYGLQPEMASSDYVIAMTSVCDREEGFRRLKEALFEIEEHLVSQRKMICCAKMSDSSGTEKETFEEKPATICEAGWAENKSKLPITPAILQMTPYEAEQNEGEFINLEESEGRISKETVFFYPPGIPVIVPGEIIDKTMLLTIQGATQAGIEAKGLKYDGKIQVVC